MLPRMLSPLLRQPTIKYLRFKVPQTLTPKARKVRIAHHMPGRMRLKVLGEPAEPEFFAMVKKAIASLDGVRSVRINSASSSIVIDYSPVDTIFHFRLQDDPDVSNWLSMQSDVALLAGIDEAVTTGAQYLAQHSRLAEQIVSGAERLDLKLRCASDGYLDLKLLLPLFFAAATSMRQARGRGTPMWLSLGTFAFNSFISLHRERINAPVIKIASTGMTHARS
jgi:copper chaperone CopZ